MADDKSLIASSEFDPSAFLKGMQAMTAGVEAFIKKEQDLTAALDQQEKQLAESQKAIAATKAQIDALDKSSNTFKNDLAALNKQQSDQRASQTQVQQQVKATRTELEGTRKTVVEYSNALKNLGLTARQVSDQNKGKLLFNATSLTQQVNQVQQAGQQLRNIFKDGIDDDALKQLEERLVGVTDEFQQLAIVLEVIKQKMDTLDPNSEEFKQLAEIVTIGEQVLQDFGKVVDETGKKSQSTRTRMRELRTHRSAYGSWHPIPKRWILVWQPFGDWRRVLPWRPVLQSF
jgi:DNA repair exonuclease SbcCD ATPase subunit